MCMQEWPSAVRRTMSRHATTQVCCGCLSIAPSGQSFLVCGRCFTAEYCTKECQRAHWRRHRAACTDMALQKVRDLASTLALSDSLENVHEWLEDAETELASSDTLCLDMFRDLERLWALMRVVYEDGFRKGAHGDGHMWETTTLYVAVLNFVGQCVRREGMQHRQQAFVNEVYHSICRERSPIDLTEESAVRLAKECGDMLATLGRNSDAVEVGRRVRGAWLQLEQDGTKLPLSQDEVFEFLYTNTQWYQESAVEKFVRWALIPDNDWDCPGGEECDCQILHVMFKDWRDMNKRVLDLALSLDDLCVHNVITAAKCGFNVQSPVKGLELARRALKAVEEGADTCCHSRERLRLQAASVVANFLRELRRDTEAEAVVDSILQLPEGQVAFEKDPQDAMHLLLTKARILCHREDFSGALSFALRAQELDEEGSCVSICNLLADIYDALGQLDRALEIFVECKCGKCVSRIASHHRRTATAQWEAGDHEGALAALTEYTALVREWLTKRCAGQLADTYELDIAQDPLRYLMRMLKEIGGREEEIIEAQRLMTAWTQRHEELRASVLQETREQMAQQLTDRHASSKQRRDKRGSKGKKAAKGQRGGGKGRRAASGFGRHQVGASSSRDERSAVTVQAEAGVSGKHEDGSVVESVIQEKQDDVSPTCLSELDGDLCPICLDELDEDDGDVALCACSHRFHSCCLDGWVINCRCKMLAITCPKCRSVLSR